MRPWVQCQHCGTAWMLRGNRPHLPRQCSGCNRRDWQAKGAKPRRDMPRGKLAHKFHECVRCGHVWIQRPGRQTKPVRCAGCMSPYWQGEEVRSVRVSS